MATPDTSYQKFLTEKDQDEDTPGRAPSSRVFDFGKEPHGLRGQLPGAPDSPCQERTALGGCWHWVLVSIRKHVIYC